MSCLIPFQIHIDLLYSCSLFDWVNLTSMFVNLAIIRTNLWKEMMSLWWTEFCLPLSAGSESQEQSSFHKAVVHSTRILPIVHLWKLENILIHMLNLLYADALSWSVLHYEGIGLGCWFGNFPCSLLLFRWYIKSSFFLLV